MGRARVAAVLGCVTVATVSICGCASGGSSGQRRVSLTLTAPTDGASVQVRRIYVFGEVQPTDSTVRVGGRRVAVHGGVFREPLQLHGKVTHIRIIASAPGYSATELDSTVQFVPPSPPPAGSSSSAGAASPNGLGLSLPSGATGGTSAATSLRSPQAHQDFINGCTAGGSSSARCECVYRNVLADSNLHTIGELTTFLRRTIAAELSGNRAALPPDARRVVLPCI